MRIVIISDVHGNLEALTTLPEPYDELFVLGDLGNYGPNPIEVVDWVRARASLIVRGNHDHSVGFGEDPHRIPAGRYTPSVLDEAPNHFLRNLPLIPFR